MVMLSVQKLAQMVGLVSAVSWCCSLSDNCYQPSQFLMTGVLGQPRGRDSLLRPHDLIFILCPWVNKDFRSFVVWNCLHQICLLAFLHSTSQSLRGQLLLRLVLRIRLRFHQSLSSSRMKPGVT